MFVTQSLLMGFWSFYFTDKSNSLLFGLLQLPGKPSGAEVLPGSQTESLSGSKPVPWLMTSLAFVVFFPTQRFPL